MSQSFSLPSGRVRVLLAAVAAAAVLLAAALPAAGEPGVAIPAVDGAAYGFQGEGSVRLGNVDARGGSVAAGAAQRAAVRDLGATVRWNDFGVPQVLYRVRGHLSGPSSADHVDVAREWVAEHRELFRLDAADLSAERLEVARVSPLWDAPDLGRMQRGLPPRNDDVATVVLFRQRFDGLAAARDGLLNVGVDPQGRVTWASATTTPADGLAGGRRLSAVDAVRTAAAHVGWRIDAGALTALEQTAGAGFATFRLDGVDELQYVREAALPTPADGVRRVWQTVLVADTTHAGVQAYTVFVDATTGDVWLRDNEVWHAYDAEGSAQATVLPPVVAQASPTPTPTPTPSETEEPSFPRWLHFPNSPVFREATDTSATPDTRELWCWLPGAECDRVVGVNEPAGFLNEASPLAWDVEPRSGQPTFTTEGNNARTAISEQSPFTPDTAARRPTSPTRDYSFEYADAWFTSKCDPSNFDRPDRNFNDEDAATANLFVGHNRIHDFAYYLGWTEPNGTMQYSNFDKTGPSGEFGFPVGGAQDPEVGQSQAGRMNPAFLGRDNANQITLPDGIPGVTNQYLWQPLQAGFYAPCVDGAFDMSIVAHEMGHGVQNRMVSGGLSSDQGGAMGESWSDLTAAEYNNAYALVPQGPEDPFAVAPYATGDPIAAIRNYNMSRNPLNFSDMQYDPNGTTSPHADGEIWSAVNFDIRQALVERHDAAFPSTDTRLQRICADGDLAADQCPGNRRWIQMFHDAFLLQQSDTSMLDARDAYLAADRMRFGGAHQGLLWDTFARRGMGDTAASVDGDDIQPTPGWTSPLRTDEARVRFEPLGLGGATPSKMHVYVGEYEARVTPTADTDPATPVDDTEAFVPGTYDFVAEAPGSGHVRFRQTFRPGDDLVVKVPLRRNHASVTLGAKASGDGGNHEALIDDTEATNWGSVGDGDVRGKQVTVELAGGRQRVAQVNVSAFLRPGCAPEDEATAACDPPDTEREPEPQPSPSASPSPGPTPSPGASPSPSPSPTSEPDDDPPYDTGGQNRFSALRAFDILVCDATQGSECSADDDFRLLYESPDDAFPAGRPRPRAPELTIRPFDVPDTPATHVRIRVRDNQCTGGPLYTGEANPDNDPSNDPDCVDGNAVVAATEGSTSLTQVENVRIAELQVFSGAAPPVGAADVCDPAPVAADYVDRGQARSVHRPNVDCVIATEISVGTATGGEKRYSPRTDVTRGQMASFIVNTLQAAGADIRLPTGRGIEPLFGDTEGNVHETNIHRLALVGIVRGKTANRFDPDGHITRAQMASFMAQAAAYARGPLLAEGSYFGDVRQGNVHRRNISAGFEDGLFTGTTAPEPGVRESGVFGPADNVARDQMASFLVNLLRHVTHG